MFSTFVVVFSVLLLAWVKDTIFSQISFNLFLSCLSWWTGLDEVIVDLVSFDLQYSANLYPVTFLSGCTSIVVIGWCLQVCGCLQTLQISSYCNNKDKLRHDENNRVPIGRYWPLFLWFDDKAGTATSVQNPWARKEK